MVKLESHREDRARPPNCSSNGTNLLNGNGYLFSVRCYVVAITRFTTRQSPAQNYLKNSGRVRLCRNRVIAR